MKNDTDIEIAMCSTLSILRGGPFILRGGPSILRGGMGGISGPRYTDDFT